MSAVEFEGLFTGIACRISCVAFQGMPNSQRKAAWPDPKECLSLAALVVLLCSAQKKPSLMVSIISSVHLLLSKVIGADHDMQKMIEKYEENRDQILNPPNRQHHL